MQGGTCSQTLCRRKNQQSCPPQRSCSNRTLASRVEECILTVLALEGCPARLSIQAPFAAAAGRAASHPGEVLCGLSGASCAVVSCQQPPGSRKREGVLIISFSTPSPPIPQTPAEARDLLRSGPVGDGKTELGPGSADLLCDKAQSAPLWAKDLPIAHLLSASCMPSAV